MTEKTFTLEELAEAFDLTPRTARHYIENLLPEHHKTGRGKVARYGMDTWHCFAFIRRAKEEGLTNQQIADVLGKISQEQVDRVAMGVEELSIVPISPMASREASMAPARMSRVSDRALSKSMFEFSAEVPGLGERYASKRSDDLEPPESPESSQPRPTPRWQVLYSDDTLQITHQGEAGPEQREQVRLAARLIKKILGD